MHTCTQPGGRRCLRDRLRSLKSPAKPTATLRAAGLALPTSSVRITSVTSRVTASAARPFPRSPPEQAGQEDVLERIAFCGATLRPTLPAGFRHYPCPQLPTVLPRASLLSALQNPPAAESHRAALRKTVPTPQKQQSAAPKYLSPEGLSTSLPRS